MRRLVLFSAATLLLASGLSHAQAASDCAALANLRIEDTDLLSAAVVPAQADVPEHCRVLGLVRPAIHFEVRLPTTGWNGKFFMTGCAGLCGKIEDGPYGMTGGLRQHFAVSTTDGGHWGADASDGRWGYHNRLAETDWAYRAVPETARVSKALIKAFYGAAQRKSYFAGCSNGGRQANMEASRYPEDFDGILSGAPALDVGGLTGTWYAWVVRANTGPDGKAILQPAKVNTIHDAVLRACDAKDGLADGIIDDPRACDFEPATLQCAGSDRAQCLTAAEVGVLEKWYGGARNSRGDLLYRGSIPYGSEPYWWLYLTGNADVSDPVVAAFGRNFLRYLAFEDDPGDAYRPTQFDFDADPPKIEAMRELYRATDPDLRKFKARGGKLLMWHGWGDVGVTPQLTIEYYEDVERHMGGRAATQDFLRLFMVPGMDHCGGLPGPGITAAGFDPFTALQRWVEDGVPPEQLLATKTDEAGKVAWARPLCPYPKAAQYRGTGDRNNAASFACVEPTARPAPRR